MSQDLLALSVSQVGAASQATLPSYSLEVLETPWSLLGKSCCCWLHVGTMLLGRQQGKIHKYYYAFMQFILSEYAKYLLYNSLIIFLL